jgi:hypothetical protein
MDRNDANALIERLIELWNAHDVEGIADVRQSCFVTGSECG